MKNQNIPGLDSSKNSNGNIVITSNKTDLIVPFYKDESYILDNISFIKFIKNVEMQVRTSKEYRAYIKYLTEELDPPLNHCMVFSNITDDVAPIELHHGPIYTLFDYVEIIIGYYIRTKTIFSSSKIFSTVMDEHRFNNIQVVMLCEAVHNSIHNAKEKEQRFLDYKMAHGNIVEFINKYYLGLSFNHIGKLKRYFETYEKNVNKKDKFFDEFITKWCDEILV